MPHKEEETSQQNKVLKIFSKKGNASKKNGNTSKKKEETLQQNKV